MGETKNEILCHREAGDHQIGRAFASASKTNFWIGWALPGLPCYRWYDLYQRFGEDALVDKRPGPRRAWNRVPDEVHNQILEMALERSELSPRELAVTFLIPKVTSCLRPVFTGS